MTIEEIKEKIVSGLWTFIVPKDRTEESAKQIADLVDFSIGVATFEDEESGEEFFGVVIDSQQVDLNLTKENQ